MDPLQFEPLKWYEQTLKQTHTANAEAYFQALSDRSGVNAEQNRRTVAQYRAAQRHVEKTESRAMTFQVLRVLLIILAVLAGIAAIIGIFTHWLVIAVGALLLIASIVIVVKVLSPRIKHLEEVLEKARTKAQALLDEAQKQMAPLNALFDDRDTFRLLEKTLPQLELDDHFSVEQEQNLLENYDLVGYHEAEHSVLDTLSGRFSENPFFYERRRIHQMGMEVYHGYRTISWTETYRDSEGRMRTRTRTQTLHASVSKPKPFYRTDTVLHYGSQAAPDLSFSRKAAHHEDKSEGQIERMVKRGEKKLKRKSAKSVTKGGSFTEMTNSEFDVLFGAIDRNHEVQFRLMFTPLAQLNMVDLMRSETGYGDDFEFRKLRRHNIICSEHAQHWRMDTSASGYCSYSYDEAKQKFLSFNAEYFKSVFFDLAPLLAVPVYQEEPASAIVPRGERAHCFTVRECEVLANILPPRALCHEASRTEAIFKAEHLASADRRDTVLIKAYSYATEPRVDLIPVLGGDGHFHTVTVPWVEYIPVLCEHRVQVVELGISEREFCKQQRALLDQYFPGADGAWGYRHGLLVCVLD